MNNFLVDAYPNYRIIHFLFAISDLNRCPTFYLLNLATLKEDQYRAECIYLAKSYS